jgi:hypothetical protein
VKYAVVVLHPEKDKTKMDFSSKECEDEAAVVAAVQEVLDLATRADDTWRLIHIVHIEDLPLLMDGAVVEP